MNERLLEVDEEALRAIVEFADGGTKKAIAELIPKLHSVVSQALKQPGADELRAIGIIGVVFMEAVQLLFGGCITAMKAHDEECGDSQLHFWLASTLNHLSDSLREKSGIDVRIRIEERQ